MAADKWRQLTQLLQEDVPNLITEVERLEGELGEMSRGARSNRYAPPGSDESSYCDRSNKELLTVRDFAGLLGVTVACVRSWRLKRKISAVKLGRIIRMPRTEVQRLIDEGMSPARPFQQEF